jgi:hypothetical protein
MAEGTGGTANFTPEIDNWLNEIGENTLLFKQGDSPIDQVKNKYIELWRKQLEAKKHIGASRELYSSLGEGWQVIREGKSVRIILELPEYYYYTDKKREPTSGGGDGALRKNLSYQSSSLKGWIAAKGLVPSSGMEFKYTRELKSGTKTYTRKLTAAQSNIALSFMIARKIHKFGYKGTNWFSDLLPDFEQEMGEAIEKQFGDDTEFNIEIV